MARRPEAIPRAIIGPMVRLSDVLAGLFRVAVVVFALVGTRQIYLEGDAEGLSYFTNLTCLGVAVVFAWAGLAVLLRRRQPPSWLKGGVTLFAAVTGLISFFVLPPEAAGAPEVLAGLTDGQIEHEVIPIAVVVDFLLFDAHRRMRLRYAAYWIAAMVVYLVVTLVRGEVVPSAGYPYGFIDVADLGYPRVLVNVLLYGAGIYALGVVLWGIDRVFPKRPIVGSGVGASGQGSASGARASKS